MSEILSQKTPTSPDRNDCPLRSKSQQAFIEAAKSLLSQSTAIKTPCVLFDRAILDRQIDQWFAEMPDIKPHFAVKACDATGVLLHLRDRGVAFDAATGGELERLHHLGVPGSDIVMTHPIRDHSDLAAIKKYQPNAVVVQKSDEVRKLAESGIPNAGYSPLLLVRIALPYSNLNKFGVQCIVPVEKKDGSGTTTAFDYRPLKSIYSTAMKVEQELSVKYGGFGFAGHVGTNTTHPSHYQHLFGTFRVLGRELRERAGIRITHFDIGGGYCDSLHAESDGTSQRDLLRSIYQVSSKFRAEYGDDINIIAEPGRYMVADSAAVITRAKIVSDAFFRAVDGVEVFEKHKVIHLDDGVYGNLMGQLHDGRRYSPISFRVDEDNRPVGGKGVPCIMWGPTCDSFDRILPPDDYRVPDELQTGDLFAIDCMGAYTTVTATEFNKTQPSTIVLFRRAEDGSYGHTAYNTKGDVLNIQ